MLFHEALDRPPEVPIDMSDLVTTWTSLPNLHPALVHFPIALAPAAWAFDLAAACWSRHRDWLARAATVLWALAALGAGAAYRAGRQAGDSLADVAPQVQAHLATHSDWGLYTLWVLGLLAAARLGLALWDREGQRAAPSAIFAFVGLAAVALVTYTADLGGGLVYEHGVAVTAVAAEDGRPAGEEVLAGDGTEGAVSTEGDSSALARLVRHEDGTLSWRPRPGDGDALGAVVEVVTEEGGAVRWVEPGTDPPAGLPIDVEGRVLLLLPGLFGDVQVQAEIVPAGFEGLVGLVHHSRGPSRAGLLTVTLPAGELALGTARGPGDVETLDSAVRELPAEGLPLAVSAIGRHLRGTLGGELVVHGHEPSQPDGRTGLVVDGSGGLRILEVRVTPIREH